MIPSPRSQTPCGSVYFFVPPDIVENYSKYTNIRFSGHFIMKIVCVSLVRLESALDADSWPTKRMIRLLKRGVKVPPITVVTYLDGTVRLEDGNTRVAALKAMGERGRVPAIAVIYEPIYRRSRHGT